MIKKLSILLLMVFALIACKKETPQTPKPAVEQKPAKVSPVAMAQAVTPAPQPQEVKVEQETYLYESQGRRDPFLSIIEAAKREKEGDKKKKGLRPAETFDVGEVKVIAIASDTKSYYAMVQFPDKKYATIKQGMALGPYGGKVISIDAGRVVVREYVKDYKGIVQPKDTILKLRQEEGE